MEGKPTVKNIKYYILAYSMLIYLFLEKYITLLYLLFKIRFVDKNKNIDYVFYGDGKRYCEFNPDKKSSISFIVVNTMVQNGLNMF